MQSKLFLRAIFIAMITMSLALPGSEVVAQENKTNTQKNKAQAKSSNKAKSANNQKKVRTSTTRKNAVEKHTEKRPSFAAAMGFRGNEDLLSLKSSVALIVDRQTH